MITIGKLIALLFVFLDDYDNRYLDGSDRCKILGSTTVFPLGAECAETFNSIQNDYHVSVAQGGTGGGITDIAEGRSDLAMASREVTSD